MLCYHFAFAAIKFMCLGMHTLKRSIKPKRERKISIAERVNYCKMTMFTCILHSVSIDFIQFVWYSTTVPFEMFQSMENSLAKEFFLLFLCSMLTPFFAYNITEIAQVEKSMKKEKMRKSTINWFLLIKNA